MEKKARAMITLDGEQTYKKAEEKIKDWSKQLNNAKAQGIR